MTESHPPAVQKQLEFYDAGKVINVTAWILGSRSASLRLPVDDEAETGMPRPPAPREKPGSDAGTPRLF